MSRYLMSNSEKYIFLFIKNAAPKIPKNVPPCAVAHAFRRHWFLGPSAHQVNNKTKYVYGPVFQSYLTDS